LNVFDFLARLRSMGIQVTAENGKLKVNAPQGAVTPEIRKELHARKSAILSLLGGLDTIPLIDRNGPLPLSPAQDHLWQLQRLTPDTAAYNMYAVFRLCGPLDIDNFEQAMRAVAERHWSLRTSFPRSVDGLPQQVIASASTIMLQRVNIPPSSRSQETLHSLIHAEIRKPFDLQTGPLFRSTLFQIDSKESILLFIVHHIVSDGHSLGVLYRDLQRAYQAVSSGIDVDESPLSVQYIDYAAWLNNWLSSEAGAYDREYWQAQLAGEIPALELPTDHPYPVRSSSDGGFVDMPIPPALYADLQDLCRREGVTFFAVALTAFNILLHRYSGQQLLLVCSPVAARGRIELSDLIGYFNNTLLICSDLRKT
jgi:hypothetical protein